LIATVRPLILEINAKAACPLQVFDFHLMQTKGHHCDALFADETVKAIIVDQICPIDPCFAAIIRC
jgi:hypothetical protein